MSGMDFLEKIGIPLVAAIIGAVIGAILAFRYQRKMEIQRDKRGLMQMLMAYRSVGAVEIDWIKALNMVDIVFHDNKKVKSLLRKYFYYTDGERFKTGEHASVLVQLIYEMGQASGYKDLTEADIRDAYTPIAINSIYAYTLDRFAQKGGSSEPPPSKSE